MSRTTVIKQIVNGLYSQVNDDQKQYINYKYVNKAFASLERAGLIEDLLIGDYLQINKIMDVIMRGVQDEERVVTVAATEEETSKLQQFTRDLKLMLWALEKIGDIPRAKKAFAQAVKCLEDM
jgi:hypothetical protein